jgi:hypothetical protein
MHTRFRRLGDPWSDFIARKSKHAIAVTLQPNFGWSDGATGSTRVRNLTKGLFYRLDELYTGCPQPRWLAHKQRFNGFVVVEKRNVSPHVHLLLSCESFGEQMTRSTFLLEVADNVVETRKDPRDDRWQRSTREFISRRPWSQVRSWAPNQSLVTLLEPKATVMVQVLVTDDDMRRWAGYISKGWGYSADDLAERQSTPVDDWALDWFELRDFFPPDPARAARPWKSGKVGVLTLDLDDLAWRLPGKGILK